MTSLKYYFVPSGHSSQITVATMLTYLLRSKGWQINTTLVDSFHIALLLIPTNKINFYMEQRSLSTE